jgi:hypothetical protein
MNHPVAQSDTTEQDRKHRLSELVAESGSQQLEQYKPGSFGCHELLDRTAVLGDLIESTILSHPACVQNSEWYAIADQAAGLLRELYQRIGADHLQGETSQHQPEK